MGEAWGGRWSCVCNRVSSTPEPLNILVNDLSIHLMGEQAWGLVKQGSSLNGIPLSTVMGRLHYCFKSRIACIIMLKGTNVFTDISIDNYHTLCPPLLKVFCLKIKSMELVKSRIMYFQNAFKSHIGYIKLLKKKECNEWRDKYMVLSFYKLVFSDYLYTSWWPHDKYVNSWW